MIQGLLARLRKRRLKTLKRGGAHPLTSLRLVVGDRDARIARALAAEFHDADAVEVVEGNLLDATVDGVVCPGNSFGDMGGGFDKAIDDLYDGAAQAAVESFPSAQRWW